MGIMVAQEVLHHPPSLADARAQIRADRANMPLRRRTIGCLSTLSFATAVYGGAVMYPDTTTEVLHGLGRPVHAATGYIAAVADSQRTPTASDFNCRSNFTISPDGTTIQLATSVQHGPDANHRMFRLDGTTGLLIDSAATVNVNNTSGAFTETLPAPLSGQPLTFETSMVQTEENVVGLAPERLNSAQQIASVVCSVFVIPGNAK